MREYACGSMKNENTKSFAELYELLEKSLHHKEWMERFEGLIADGIVFMSEDMHRTHKDQVEAAVKSANYAISKIEKFQDIFQSLNDEDQLQVSIILKALWMRRVSLATPEESAKAQAAAEVARFFTRGSEQLRKYPSAN